MPFILPIVAAVSAAVGAVGSFVAGLGIVGQALVLGGIGIASSYILSALTPKPKVTDSAAASPGGVNFERQYGTDVARQVACGLVGIAGHDTYINTFGNANKWLQQIYTLSDYYSTELTRVAANGEYITLGDDDGSGRGRPVTSGEFAGFIWIKFLDGRQTEADALLVANANPSDRWSVNDIGIGMSGVIVTMLYDQNKNNSFPDFFFEFKGAPLYDIRKDTTAGGSGTHRWGDVTTHEYSANPIVIEYNYRRGFSVNTDLFCGMDMPATDLPFDKWVTAMNICDEIQSDGDPRYECSILLNCGSTHSDNIQSISLSCGSMQIDAVDGSWPLVGSDQPTVATFTDDDIISTADFRRTEKQSMAQLVNSVSGNYPEPDQLWSMIGYDPQIAADYVAIDRRTRDISIDFPQVRNARQAAQLAWIYLYENRYEATATVTLRPAYQRIEAGDWVGWNSARYGNKKFIVTGTQLKSLDASDGPRNAVVTLQERDGQIYDGVTPPPIVIPTRPGEPVYLAEVEDFNLVAVSIVGEDGRAVPAIRASWLPIADPTITQVTLTYYPTGQETSALDKTVTADKTVALLDGVVGNTEYTVRARVLTNPLRTTVYNAGKTVTTLNITVSNDDAVRAKVAAILAQYDDRISGIEQAISSVARNANGRQWNDKQMVQRQMQSITGNLSASITEVMTVATDTQTAFADYQLVVNAQLADQSATITEQATAIADINGNLLASWSMTLNVGGHISGIKNLNDGTLGLFVIDTDVFQVANPAVSGGAATTVFSLQTVNGDTQMALKGDFFADGVITARMLTVTSLTAISAHLGNATVDGALTGPSGKLVINMTNDRIEMFA